MKQVEDSWLSGMRTRNDFYLRSLSILSSPTVMSAISAEEKRRLLREKRQAKMAKGNASNRLNEILSQGSSVKTNAKSVLDQPESQASPIPTVEPSATPLHDDPEVPDISTILQANTPASEGTPDMDEVFKKIFGGTGQNPDGTGADAGDQNPFISQIMQMISEGGGPQGVQGQQDEVSSYQTQLAQYHAYRERKLKVHLLIVRYIVHLVNFFFHYINSSLFQSSPHLYIRGLSGNVDTKSFFSYFMASEIVFVSAFFGLLASKGLLGASSKNRFVSKAMNFGSLILPQISRFQPMVETILVYSEGLGIILADIALIVLLFGFVSIYG